MANTQLEQATHRFEEGVASNIEVIQAQNDLARANENLIDSMFTHRTALGALARALGVAEEALIASLVGFSDDPFTQNRPNGQELPQ